MKFIYSLAVLALLGSTDAIRNTQLKTKGFSMKLTKVKRHNTEFNQLTQCTAGETDKEDQCALNSKKAN